MATSNLATTQSNALFGASSSATSGSRTGGQVTPFIETFVQLFTLVGKALLLLLLMVLLVFSFVAWIWVASFRNGWRLWDWFVKAKEQKRSDEQISYSLLYGMIIWAVTPVILFSSWSQKQLKYWLPEWMHSPFVDLPVRQIIEDQLGVQLGSVFPGLSGESIDPTPQNAVTGTSESPTTEQSPS